MKSKNELSESEKDFSLRIDTRLDEIGERVATIEGKLDDKSPKGLKKTISEFGGIIALILSIAIGSFTILDKLVYQPSKEMTQEKIDFRNDADMLAGIVQQIAGLDWQGNPQGAKSQAQALTPKKLALLEKLKKSAIKMPDILQFADHLLIANEFSAFGRWQEALDQLELAQVSAKDQSQVANAYWAKARLNGAVNEMRKSREFYLLALSEFKSLGIKTNAGTMVEVYIQWISFELINGTCTSALEAQSKMLDDLNSPDVWPNTKEWARTMFEQMLSMSPKTCNLKFGE